MKETNFNEAQESKEENIDVKELLFKYLIHWPWFVGAVEAALDYDKLLDKLRGSEGEKNIRDQQNALITSLNLRLNGVSKKRTRLYEDYAEGLLDEEEYAFAKKSYDEQ